MKKILNYCTLIMVFVALFLTFYSTVPEISRDLGRHITLGKIIVETGSIPNTNYLSYKFGDFPFINSHWLSEVIFYLINNSLGLNGLLVLTTILAILSFTIIYKIALTEAGIKPKDTYILNILALISVVILSGRSNIRPEIFSYFLLSIFLFILFKYRKKITKLIFILIPLGAIWVNLHIYFVIGIILIGIFLLSLCLENRKNISSFIKTTHFKWLFFTLLGVIVASFINPNTIHGVLYPFTYSSNYGVAIWENTDLLFFHTNLEYYTLPLAFFDILIILLIIFLLRYKKARIIDVLLILIFFVIAFTSVRNVILFALVTMPSLLMLAPTIDFKERKKKFLVIFIAFAYAIIFILLLNQLHIKRLGWGDSEYSKEKALDFFIQNNISGPIYNNMEIGGYISYRLYPKEKPFIDERPEAYPQKFMSVLYNEMQTKPEYFNSIAERFGFNTTIITYYNHLPTTFINIKNLLNNPSWKLIYLNDQIVIFVKNNAKNKYLIDKYGMDKNTLKIGVIPDNLYGLTNLAVLLKNLSLYKDELKIDELMLEKKPNDCKILQRTIELNKQFNRPFNSHLTKFNKLCGTIFF